MRFTALLGLSGLSAVAGSMTTGPAMSTGAALTTTDNVPACASCAATCSAVTDPTDFTDANTLACWTACDPREDCYDDDWMALDPAPANCADYAACSIFDSFDVRTCDYCDPLCGSLTPEQSADLTDNATLACVGVCTEGMGCFDLTTFEPLGIDDDCDSYEACASLLAAVYASIPEPDMDMDDLDNCTTCDALCGGLTPEQYADFTDTGTLACVDACSDGTVCFDNQTYAFLDPMPYDECGTYISCAGAAAIIDFIDVDVPACDTCDSLCGTLTPEQVLDPTDLSTLSCLGSCVTGISCFDFSTGLPYDPLPDDDCESYTSCAALLALLAPAGTTAGPGEGTTAAPTDPVVASTAAPTDPVVASTAAPTDPVVTTQAPTTAGPTPQVTATTTTTPIIAASTYAPSVVALAVGIVALAFPPVF